MQNTQQFTLKTDYLAFSKAKITIQDWIAAWNEADNDFRPRRHRLLNIYEMAMVDNHLSAVVENRKMKVAGEPFIVFNKAGEVDETLGKLLESKWFSDFVWLALDAIAYGFTLIELNPAMEVGKMGPTKQVDRRNILPERNEVLIKYYNETGIRYDAPTISDFYIYAEAGYGLGLLNKAIFWTIYKRSSNGSHATFNEEFGIPMLIAKSNGDDEEKADLLETLKKLGKQKMGVIGLDEEIIAQYAAAISGASDNFEAMSERANSEMSKLFLGHVKGTDDDKGSQAYINKDQSEKSPSEERKEKDMQFIENLVNDELFPRLTKFGMDFEGCKFMYLHTYMTAQARKKKAFAPDMLRLLLENYEIAPEWIEANFEVPVKKKPLPLIEPQKNLPAPTQANNLLPDLYGKMPEAVNGIVEDFFELFTEAMNEWAKEIYAGGGEALNEDMITLNYEAIWSGLVSRMKLKGYTDAYIQALRENVFIFSGAKTYEEYTQIKSFLVDEKGNKRSFQDFSDLVLKVNSTYNKQYLDAEYELAVASSQMIQLWQDIEKEDNPMLQFYAVGDERTTPICKNLNKITLPANDSFWDKYYPPNHWRCRSTVKVVYDETPTATLKNLPTLNKEFQNNVGKTSTVFTEAHPYFDKLPEAISKELLKKAKEYAQ